MTTVSEKIDAKLVKELREKSGAPMGDCLKALQEAKGDIEDAFVVLRKRGIASAQKKAARTTNEGAVGTYIHAGGKIGVLIELNCESDFVARTNDFQDLLKDIAMHIAASDPRYVKPEDVTTADLEREKEIYRAQAAATGKPAPVIEKIVEGKMGKFYEEVCLLEQPLHQGPGRDHQGPDRAEGGQAGREHHRPPLCAVQGGVRLTGPWRRPRPSKPPSNTSQRIRPEGSPHRLPFCFGTNRPVRCGELPFIRPGTLLRHRTAFSGVINVVSLENRSMSALDYWQHLSGFCGFSLAVVSQGAFKGLLAYFAFLPR